MLLLRFFHSKNLLLVGEKKYSASCTVRNEINEWRKKNETVKTMPLFGSPKYYYPRKFPTGVWEIKSPEWTNNPEFCPVKIPTTAKRTVLLWSVENGRYKECLGQTQEDSFYHLHYAKNSKTTLGCIRLNSKEDAIEIAKKVESELLKGIALIEVIA